MSNPPRFLRIQCGPQPDRIGFIKLFIYRFPYYASGKIALAPIAGLYTRILAAYGPHDPIGNHAMTDSTLVYQTVPTLDQIADSCLVQTVLDHGFEFIDYESAYRYRHSVVCYTLEIPRRYATPESVRGLIRESLYKMRYGDDSLASAKARLAIGELGSYLGLYQPAPADKDSALMAIYATKADFDKESSDSMGKRTIGKPAKILRKIFPFLDESACTWFAEQWKEAFSPESLTIKSGKARADFARAYSHEQTKCKNPAYIKRDGLYVKSLSGSCMRHSFGFKAGHPSEVYASGDFESVWAEDEKGRIAARVVVNTSKQGESCFIPAPIYANSDCAAIFVLEYLKTRGYKSYTNDSWHGAELLAIPHKDDSYLMPYIDMDQELELSGDRFVIGQGDSRANETQGYIRVKECVAICDCCGDQIQEDDTWHYDDSSCESYCESCTDSNYFRCEGTGELTPNSELVTVYDIRKNWNRIGTYRAEQCYSESYAMDNCTVTESGDWFTSDSVIYSESFGPIPIDEIGDNCEYVQTESDIFLRVECIKLPCGIWQHIESELDSDIWTLTEGVLSLNQPYELDESGYVINRQIALELVAA